MTLDNPQQINIKTIRQALHKYPATQIVRNQHHQAAVCMLLRESAQGIEILFIQRAEHADDPWSGQIAFPGGRREKIDINLISTGQRETLEEINVNLSGNVPVNATYLGQLDELQGRRASQKINMIIACSVYLIEDANHAEGNYEVARIDWVSLAHLSTPKNHASIKFEFNDTPYPCVNLPYKNLKLWGLTYRFVSNLITKIKQV